ncbi:MAG: universal stress protein, partial [Halobacteria archaeon]|nr:universal stress protein [Halobacteria archaeon]
IANPNSVEQLMRTAIDIANERNAEIEVMSVVTVPEQTPLSEGRKFVGSEREVLDKAIEFAGDSDVPVHGTIRIGHDVAKAILNTVDFVLGSNVDRVVTGAKCDVLVERIGSEGQVNRILLPTAGGSHAELAAEIAHSISVPNDADIDIVYVVDPGASESERKDAEKKLKSTEEVLEGYDRVSTRLIEGTDVVDTIVDESEGYDITIIGATREGMLQQLVFGVIPEQVGKRARNTVIMAKRYTGIKTWLNRWLRWR